MNTPSGNPRQTEPLDPADDVTHDVGRADVADLSFLGPPQRTGSLGRMGHYEVLETLGQGGFGIVFRAFDDDLQRVVAVKVLSPQMSATSPARKRFLREARSAAQVRHENVVQIYAIEETPIPYIVMEYVPGETLQQRLTRTGPLDVAEVTAIGQQIADALAAAHDAGLIHRDVKPGNVLLEAGPRLKVKVTDFGLARTADDASITQSGALVGTPLYMSPEQARGVKLDHRSDLFSLGSVLYALTSGRPPFRAEGALAILKRVAEDEPRPILEIIPETPAWLCRVIRKLHAKNPDDRYQSAREVADLLATCEEKLEAKQPVTGILPAVARSPARKWLVAAALLLLPVIALGVTELAGVTHLFRPQPDPTPVELAKQPPRDPTVNREPPVVVTPAAADADRKIAEMMLSLGGSVRVNDGVLDITAGADLPNGPILLRHVDLAAKAGADDAALKRLATCRYLTGLNLRRTAVTDGGLAHLKDNKRLLSLNLRDTKVTDAGLIHLKDNKYLLSLDLQGTAVTDAGLAHLADCTDLLYLNLSGTRMTNAGLALFKRCKYLRELDAWANGVSVKGLADILAAVPGCEVSYNGNVMRGPIRWPLEPSKAEDIKRLLEAKAVLTMRTGRGSEVKVTTAEELPKGPATIVGVVLDGRSGGTDDQLLERVAHLEDLERLAFDKFDKGHDQKISPEGLSKLSALVHLRSLELAHLASRAKGAEGLSKSMPDLRFVSPPYGLADEWAVVVAERPSITRLFFYRTALTDKGLATLEKAKHLQFVDLSDTGVTPAAVERFAAAVQGCRIVWGFTGQVKTIEPRRGPL